MKLYYIQAVKTGEKLAAYYAPDTTTVKRAFADENYCDWLACEVTYGDLAVIEAIEPPEMSCRSV